MWDALRLDVRHSFRSLRRAPTFSLIVIGTLTLAVGATAAVGSLLNAVVLRTLAVTSPEQLVALSALESGATWMATSTPTPSTAYRATQRSFAQMSMYAGGGLARVETASGVFENAVTEVRLAELLRPRRRASRGGTVLQRLRRCRGRDHRGLPPAHLRRGRRHRRGNQVRRGCRRR